MEYHGAALNSEVNIHQAHEAMLGEVKQWLTGGTGADFSSMASGEVLATLQERSAPAEIIEKLRVVLETHQSRTYAGNEITQSELTRSIEYSSDVIDWTVSVEQRSQ